MKALFSFLFLLVPCFFWAQVDAIAIERNIDSLLKASDNFKNKYEYQNALKINQEADSIVLSVFGSKSLLYSRVCFDLGIIFYKKNDFELAKNAFLKVKKIQEIILTEENLDYAETINYLGIVTMILGEYQNAETYFIKSKNIRKGILGTSHKKYCASLINIGLLYNTLEKHSQSIPYLQEAKSIFENEIKDLTHLFYFNCVSLLAITYKKLGDYKKSEELFLKTVAIRLENLGELHPEYATSLNMLAELYQEMGLYKKAEPIYLNALNIMKKSVGKEHPWYFLSKQKLGFLYIELGNYKKAEQCFIEIIRSQKSIFGTKSNKLVPALTMFAILYDNLGNYKKAEKLYLEALGIQENTRGKENMNYAFILEDLGILYYNWNYFEKALQYNLQANTIFKNLIDTTRWEYLANVINSANIYSKLGNFTKSEKLYLKAKVIFEEHNTNLLNSSTYLKCLHNLAALYLKTRSYSNAQLLLHKVTSAQKETIGKNHPYYSESLQNLAILHINKNNLYRASKLISEVSEFRKSHLIQAVNHLSEKELLSYLFKFKNSLNHNFSFVQKANSLEGESYNNLLFYKGFLINKANQFKKLVKKDSLLHSTYHAYLSTHHLLSKEFTKQTINQANIVKLELVADSLEKVLVNNIYSNDKNLQFVSWQQVKSKLLINEAALEFIHYNYYNPDATDSIMYAALILKPNDTLPTFISLFEEKQLDSLIHNSTSPTESSIEQLYTTRGFVKDKNPNHKNLYQLIWEPLDSLLQDVETIYFSPSGLLHRINMAAIAVDSTTILGDRYLLRQLNSTRNLVIPPTITPANNDITLYGGIHYESLLKSPAADIIFNNDSTEQYKSSLTFSNLTREWRGGTWNYLPGTEKETNVIARIMSEKSYTVNLVQGHAATEEAFKQIGEEGPSPRILHIATHGFFFPDPVDTLQRHRLIDDEPVFKLSDNPMIRSGLLLAGANHAWSGGEVSEEAEDGILTAYEISQMNLSNTELVVLSACETGLGDIDGNEGVYGLQRAFKIAGAKYLIMSLWQVPDLETSEFMQTFYREWLGGKSIHEAFAFAQRHMRELNTDPYFWGGFVLVE